jgi:sugar lactone lactonase YvrE
VEDGSLLVADTGNRQLLRFSPPAWERELVAVTPGPVVGLEWADGFVAAAVPADSAIVLVDVDEKSVVRRIEIPGWNDREQQEGYLAMLPSGDLVASAPTLGQLWRVDPSGESPAQLMAEDLPGVTGIALLPDGQLIGSLTWENRMVKIPVKP